MGQVNENEKKDENDISSIVDINNIKNIKTIREHSGNVYSLLLLSDGRLASCSLDKTIKIYNINNNYQCDITIKNAHTSYINYISELDNNQLISFSDDKSIKIWSINQSSYRCDYTNKDAHDYYNINKVISLRNNRIASCSEDNTIKIWNSNHPYKKIRTLEGHTESVTSIIELKDKDILISVSNDWTLRKWNLLTYQCETIINGIYCCSSNSLLEIDNNRIIVGGENVITIINISKDIIEEQIYNDKLGYVCSLLQLRDGNILCGCGYSSFEGHSDGLLSLCGYRYSSFEGHSDGLLCLYDIKSKTLSFRKNKINNYPVSCLLNINKNKFISCSFGKTIKVWKY